MISIIRSVRASSCNNQWQVVTPCQRDEIVGLHLFVWFEVVIFKFV
jgi:hypothetical protein